MTTIVYVVLGALGGFAGFLFFDFFCLHPLRQRIDWLEEYRRDHHRLHEPPRAAPSESVAGGGK